MKGLLALLGGIGAGALLMYMYDPDRGNRRRALVRDKMMKLNRQTQQALTGHAKDLRNRAKGLLHDAKVAFEPKDETNVEQPVTFS
jgi:hypothetical protein